MIFTELELHGVYLVESVPYVDDRGVFTRQFSAADFAEAGLDSAVADANLSWNPAKGTLRGFHYQIEPYGEAKTMSCLRGSIYDIVVDLREDSPTYLRWTSVWLDDERPTSIHVPAGCANAWMTLEDNTLVHYHVSAPHRPQAERGIRFDDPLFKFDWPFHPEVISAKDMSWPDFQP